MRVVFRSALVGLLVACLVQAPVFGEAAGGSNSPLGLVLQADRARLGDDWAATGATVFDGERLWTDNAGSLRVRVGSAQAYLPSRSGAVLHQDTHGFSADLGTGTIVASSAGSDGFNLLAIGTSIRPHSDQPTVAQVTLVGPTELLLSSRKGSLDVSMADQFEVVPEGGSYRLVLQPDAQGPAGYPHMTTLNPPDAAAGGQGPEGNHSGGKPPVAAGKTGKKPGKKFLLIVLGAAAATGLGVGVWQAVQTPLTIQSPSAP